MNRTLIVLTLCGLLPVAAFAQSAQAPSAADLDSKPTESVAPAAATTTEAAEPAAKKALAERRCLQGAGSQVAARRNAKRGSPCLPLNGRSYSREDIERTGEIDIADALRKLDPAIR